MNDLPKWLIS